MNEPHLEMLDINGIRMQVATQGCGPLVLLCHGFPELWYSWRNQLAALATAGYRAVAPDMRGYGGTDAPAEPDAYTMLHLVGDMVALVHALGEQQAVIVGHDWGALVAWSAAMMRPDLFRAVVGMSVPFSPPGRVELLSALASRGISDFYIQYFQTPGVAEAELERDVESSIRRIYFSGSGDGPDGPVFGRLQPGQGFLGGMIEPETLPAWLSLADIAYYTGEFTRSGFRGGLNWYRNMTRSWALLAPWRGCIIRQPSMFIAGSRDAVLKFPGSPQQIEAFAQTLPGLRGCHILEDAGHWIQRERATEVNERLLVFLKQL
ncbi:alpha/beta fold hydrolase [Pseudomonas sp. GV085]|uniref:alpha/beta fold hydrolase n=1 Tax=Pseudomonas sp. GV085 TaxID=2135756 RepID=UPI000D362F8E|nr:alpha/beta hydrolase [Pseudomonas sp. GV085]PTR28065.1 pimeloyl-ACP methyl ester carboxylesterase [Pseudomonas sp. GV085]